ncbi:conserved hypothetical protein [Aspergillus terreus NIH2624]|uniref:NADP-dependent oxidoreductase domain-containing protein n=1 Tax=Aspergillus terreus (strain NIH 2624 / FGSC A1156) TaxID=341663 RepID=Q0C857_ASPTN|nr:uncharacterized protein ATEG_10127 [Aspergillus terreus NIH2624]EAU29576.1 conserved hypothetical protein [Aspergillus terreus NIH2624]
MTSPLPTFVFGAASFNEQGSHRTAAEVEEMLQVLQQQGITTIDTAQIYGSSEELLGLTHAAARFVIDTKHCGGFAPGNSTKEKVIAGAEESLRKLQMDKVNVFYLHAPDRQTPLEETLEGINALYQAGKFTSFGLSNFRADEVEAVIQLAKQKNFVLPTVYQGNYNPLSRKQETELLPVLRKHGLAFYAYSPLAGGFLAKSKEDLLGGGLSGRWDPRSMFGMVYHGLYNKPVFLDALDDWGRIADEAGVSRAELAYRWMGYHSCLSGEYGDAMVVGASSAGQLERTMQGLRRGALSEDVVERIEMVWEKVRDEAVLDNYNDWFCKQ